MSNEIGMVLIIIAQSVLLFKFIRDDIIQMYKIGYYEQKLKNRDIDISSVEKITLKEIIT